MKTKKRKKRVSNLTNELKMQKNPEHSSVYFDSFVRLSSFVERAKLHWKNPSTEHIIGYQRAHDLGLIHKSICGIINPKTNRLVSFLRAKQLDLLPM